MDSDHMRKEADLEVTGISRSGRVRKKSSKLMDFESTDEIEPRYRKAAAPPRWNMSTISNTSQLNSQQDSDTNNFSDEKSENEDILGEGSSDSDYYDPTLEHHDSLDSTDSEDPMISDNDNSLNSSTEHRSSRSLTRSSNYLVDKSNKRKLISKDGSFNKSSNSMNQMNFSSHSPNQQHSNSRNQQFNIKPTPYTNNSVNNNNQTNSNNNGTMYRVVGVGPLEVGAHLRLLGESLAIIGERLKEHEGQIAVSGSVSVLLDTLLCSLAPLICLTANIPSIAPPLPLLQDTLDNIAYIMPGL